jgi:hypothetical protein
MGYDRVLGWALIASAAALFLAQALPAGLCLQDDAYITLRYARNLEHGAGLVYNAGERVEGYTNFLWTVVASLPFWVGSSPESFLRWAGIGSGLLALAGTARLAFLINGRLAAGGLAAVLVAAMPWIVAESVMGLETAAFAALVTIGLARYLRERQSASRGWPASGGLLSLAALTRPEGVLVAASALLADLKGFRRQGWQQVLARWSLFAVPVGAHLAFRLAYYGEVVPNTFHAKVSGGVGTLLRGMEYGGSFLAAAFPVLLLAAGAAWLQLRRPPAWQTDARPQALWLVPLVAVLYGAYATLIGGDFKPTFRFFAVPAALACVLAATLLAEGLVARAATWRTASALLALGSVVWTLAVGQPARDFVDWRREQIPVHRAAGRFLNQAFPPHAWLATGNAGLIPYESKLPTLDMVGLCDRHIARQPAPAEPGAVAGHLKGDGDYVLARSPRIVLFQNARFSTGPLPKERVGDVLFAVSERELWNDPRFHRRYELVSTQLPGFTFNYFERRKP